MNTFSTGGGLQQPEGVGIRVELQKELQRALDRRQRRQRSQSVSSTSRERHKDVSPEKYPRHTHPRRPSSRLQHTHLHHKTQPQEQQTAAQTQGKY